MSHNALIIAHAASSLASEFAIAAAKNATSALLDAEQALSLLEIALIEASQSQIEQHKLLVAQAACIDLELFVERMQLALELIYKVKIK